MNSAVNQLQRQSLFERGFKRGLEALRSKPVIRRRTLRRRLLSALAVSGSELKSVAVKHGPAGQSLWLVGVNAGKGRVVLTIAPDVERTREYWYLFDRLPGVLYLAGLVGRDIGFPLDVSDGHMGFRSVVGFCGNHDSVCLIPDPDFFESRGYAKERREAAPDWFGRSAGILWRGSPNGQGLISNATMQACDAELIQRVRMCLLLRGQEDMDAKLVMSDRTEEVRPEDLMRLEEAGIAGQPVDRSEWWQRRFAIDIDGYTNAWSGLFTRLLMGCCVLKVASPNGCRQWYYHRLQPWVHYIPVAADLGDLQQQIEWCRAHEVECEQIAKQGRELALSMDFETEYRQAASALVQCNQVGGV